MHMEISLERKAWSGEALLKATRCHLNRTCRMYSTVSAPAALLLRMPPRRHPSPENKQSTVPTLQYIHTVVPFLVDRQRSGRIRDVTWLSLLGLLLLSPANNSSPTELQAG
nr:hypothetical protein CFP56_23875 [Quercus suber]